MTDNRRRLAAHVAVLARPHIGVQASVVVGTFTIEFEFVEQE